MENHIILVRSKALSRTARLGLTDLTIQVRTICGICSSLSANFSTAWLDMTSYYAAAFKTGSYPAITQDKIYLWARPHPKNATATSDSVPKPTNFELVRSPKVLSSLNSC
jgi:Glycosyl hydrolase family 71